MFIFIFCQAQLGHGTTSFQHGLLKSHAESGILVRGGHIWTGGYSTLFSETGLWIGFGEVWATSFRQTLPKTYFVGPRDRLKIGFEQVPYPKPYLGKFGRVSSLSVTRNILTPFPGRAPRGTSQATVRCRHPRALHPSRASGQKTN